MLKTIISIDGAFPRVNQLIWEKTLNLNGIGSIFQFHHIWWFLAKSYISFWRKIIRKKQDHNVLKIKFKMKCLGS